MSQLSALPSFSSRVNGFWLGILLLVLFMPVSTASGQTTVQMTNAIPAVLNGTTFSSGSSPGNEGAPNVIDGNVNTKYLNFSEINTGFISTATGSNAGVIVKELSFFTANDSEDRDPASFTLYGSTTTLSSISGLNTGSLTVIASGNLSLPSARLSGPTTVTFSNSVAYVSYVLIFPTVKNGQLANSMQIADVEFSGLDNTAPTLAEVTAVSTPTDDTTPSYTFSSNEAGTITYGGDCSSATTGATASNNTITFNTLAAGTHSNCTITVTDSAGNASSALNVTSFTVLGGNGIAFTGPADTDFTVGSIALTATASSGLAVSFASTTASVCTVSGSTVTFVSLGTCSITASQAGNANFVAAADVVRSFAISGDTVITKTKAIASNFVSRRAGRILSGTPALASRLGRGGSFGGTTGFSPVGLSGSGTLDNAKVAFSTSLRQVIGAGNASKKAQRKELGEMMALGEQSLLSQYNNGLQPGFDVWVKGSLDHAKNNNSKSDLGLLFIGADYHLSETTLVGVLAQFDWSDEKDTTSNFKTDGKGWMIGPYMATRLGKNLLFDGRAAYGRSSNHISPLGTFEDSFDTTRWLVSGTLTGDFNMDGWRFSPHVGVSYFEETQKAYTDSLGNNIAAQAIALGRMTFGPEVSTSFKVGEGTIVSPHIGVKGIWDFDKAQTIDLTTGLASGTDNDLRASIEAGLTTQFTNGWRLAGEGHYDGIGDDSLEAYGGSLKLTVPFN